MNRCMIATAMLVTASASLRGGVIDLITIGGFEMANTGWAVASLPFNNIAGSCNLGFASSSAASGCLAGTNPMQGNHAAYASSSFPSVNNSTGRWTNTLSQSFVVPTGLSISNATLSYLYTITDSGAGAFRGVNVHVRLLDGSTVLANQSILRDPAASGVIPWTLNSLDLTSILAAHQGQTLTLQFSSSAFYRTSTTPNSRSTALITGIDEVHLNLSQAVPEPPTVLLMASVLGTGVLWRNRKRLRGKRPLPELAVS